MHIDATLWDIFSISNILPSFCYAQRSSLRLSNIAPSLELFSKIFFLIFSRSTTVDATPQDLPHAMEDMGGIWFATWFREAR